VTELLRDQSVGFVAAKVVGRLGETPGDHPRLGPTRFEDWLRHKAEMSQKGTP
jgi:hypothetical protein